MRWWCVPTMGAEDALDVRSSGKSGVRSGLVNRNTIIVIQESKVLEGRFILLRKLEGRSDDREDVSSDVFVGTG